MDSIGIWKYQVCYFLLFAVYFLYMNTSQPGEPGAMNDKEPSRRGFLKTVGVALVGAGAALTGNKYLVEEKEGSARDAFYLKFKNQEKSFQSAIEASLLLIAEMEAINIAKVSLSGTGHPNYRVEILRNFLTLHLNTKRVGNRYYSIQRRILDQGYYDKEILLELSSQASHLLQSQEGVYPPAIPASPTVSESDLKKA